MTEAKKIQVANDGDAAHDFEMVDIHRTVIRPPQELLDEIKAVEWDSWAYYKEQKSLRFGIRRRVPMKNDMNNLCRYANAIRRFINSRTDVYVLDFIPNHEQTGGAKTVIEVGETCLVNEIRMALNGVMCRQVRGLVYELHAVNNTATSMDIMTGHITLKGETTWHDNFPPTIKLGQLEPASELHISIIYMKPGRMFTNEQPTFENGEVVMPKDHTCFMHNGFTMWRQPDMIDVKTSAQLRDPSIESPHLIEMEFYPQPYIDPSDILRRALQQLAADFRMIADHITKARTTFSNEGEAGNVAREYQFGDVAIKVVAKDGADDLMATISGFDESIGIVIASNAMYLAPTQVSHATSHLAHVTEKNVIIRITAPAAFELFAKSIALAIARTESLMKQFDAGSRD